MKKVISLILTLCVCFTVISIPIQVNAASATTEGYTTTDINLTEQYMMNGELATENNLLYRTTPHRIYTMCNTYSAEKNHLKYSTNNATDGVNSYTFSGSDATVAFYKKVVELTNGEIDIITDNDLEIDTAIWSSTSKYLGLEYDLGSEVTLDKFYICWTNNNTVGYERICRGYEIYASAELSELYNADSLVYSVTDNQHAINVVTFPENINARYFAIRITQCDNGQLTNYVYPRCKEIALSGTRTTENYATFSGIPTTVTEGSSESNFWMNDAPTTDPENIIRGISPVSASYTDTSGTKSLSSSSFSGFTNGIFDDSYVKGNFTAANYMSDSSYEDIVWDLGEAKGFWEAWLCYRAQAAGECFFLTKYQLFAGNDKDTLFSAEPIITVDGNAHNVNKISFNKRTARYFGIRVIVPNSALTHGESNIRVSISELSLLGESKRGVQVSAVGSDGNVLDIAIDGSDATNYIGQQIELTAPKNATVGKKSYAFDHFEVNGSVAESTLIGDNYSISVTIQKNCEVKAVYKQSFLVKYNAIIVTGNTSVTLEDVVEPTYKLNGESYEIASDLILTEESVDYKLSSWDINGNVTAATEDGKHSVVITCDTTVTAIYTLGGSGEYLAIFSDKANNQLGIYSIPIDGKVSDIVTDNIISSFSLSDIFGYTFSGNWSQSLDAAYNTTVHFKPVYTQETKTYDAVVNGNTIKARFDEKINLLAQSEDFSSWSHGDSIISAEPDCYIYSPGNITLIENTYGSGTEVTDYATIVNSSTWEITDDSYTAVVKANINGISGDMFIGCGVLFTSPSSLILSGTDWDNQFALGEDNVIYKELQSYPSDGCYMISLEKIHINKARYARAYVKHIVNNEIVTTYSKTIIRISAEGKDMPIQKRTDVINEYSSHPLLPLYGDNAIPYYNEEFASLVVNGSNNGNGSKTDNNPTIAPYLVEGSKKCVIIFPGGGYFQRTDTGEGIDVAKKYNDNGISAFVVRYRVGNNSAYDQGYNVDAILSDGQRAVQYVRYNAKEFGIDPDKIAVCGFSAGGHLSMMVSQNEHEANVVGDRIGEISNIPNATILSYAVTTLLTGTFSTMPPILSGGNATLQAEICEKYSGELHVTANTPPTMVWYGDADTAVKPAYNSHKYSEALTDAGVYCEEYSYADIGHGVGLNAGSGDTAWHARSVNFLNNILK